MKPRHRRLGFLLAMLALLALAVGLALYGLSGGISYFYSPTDIDREIKTATSGLNPFYKKKWQGEFRLGGLVVAGSVKKHNDDTEFVVSDMVHEVRVRYHGLLPNLFRERSGVVAIGMLDMDKHDQSGRLVFVARELLAKHDENYMPPEVATAIKKAQQWQGDNKNTAPDGGAVMVDDKQGAKAANNLGAAATGAKTNPATDKKGQ